MKSLVCRSVVGGFLALPLVLSAQTVQPTVRAIATIPGVAVDEAVRLPNRRVILFTDDDSIVAYDLTTKRRTVVALAAPAAAEASDARTRAGGRMRIVMCPLIAVALHAAATRCYEV